MTLGGFCNCGEGAVHDQIIGKEKSKAAGEYPVELCRKYAGLAVTHFIKMGKAEFPRSQTHPAGKEHREVEGDFGGPQEGNDGVQANYTSEEHFFDVNMDTKKEEVRK